MAYSMATDTYICDYCGLEMKWDDADERRGTLWGCEVCENKHFCTACFTERFGKKAFDGMMSDGEKVFCPDCYGLKYDPRSKGGDSSK